MLCLLLPCSEARCWEGVSRPYLAARGQGGPSKLALQHDPVVLTCPLSFIVPPKATIPIVLWLAVFGVSSSHFLSAQPAFQSTAGQGQRVENLDELWPETAGDGQTP